jgi:anti-sigma factor RsiW
MNCDEINSRLIELVYGEIDPAVADSCREHVAECAACRAALAELERLQNVLDAMPPREPRVDLARLCLKTAQRQRQFRARALWAGAGAAAALLVAAGLLAATVRIEVAPGQMVVAWRAAGHAAGDETALSQTVQPTTPPVPIRKIDERLAQNPSVPDATPVTPRDSYARLVRVWSHEPNYLATRDRALAFGLDALQYTATGPAVATGQAVAPASYHELQRQLLEHHEHVSPSM